MIAIPLAHKYCEASLSFACLKNADRLLRIATREVAFDMYLCIVKMSQQWAASGSEYHGYETECFIEQNIDAKHLVCLSGKKTKNLELDDERIKPVGVLESILDDVPDEEQVEEETRDEGATMDRW